MCWSAHALTHKSPHSTHKNKLYSGQRTSPRKIDKSPVSTQNGAFLLLLITFKLITQGDVRERQGRVLLHSIKVGAIRKTIASVDKNLEKLDLSPDLWEWKNHGYFSNSWFLENTKRLLRLFLYSFSFWCWGWNTGSHKYRQCSTPEPHPQPGMGIIDFMWSNDSLDLKAGFIM